MSKDYVTASELGQYVYCECCWIDDLEGKGVLTEAMMIGTKEHERSNTLFRRMVTVRSLAIILLLLGLFLLSLYAVLLMIGVSL